MSRDIDLQSVQLYMRFLEGDRLESGAEKAMGGGLTCNFLKDKKGEETYGT
jgi:hypothetical protein